MLGVILWSDPETRKAVIWCEDHGQLAFYHPDPAQVRVAEELAVGDLVKFELRQDSNLRYAHNVILVSGKQYKDIAENLVSSTQSKKNDANDILGNVIEFKKIKIQTNKYAVA